MTLTHADLFDVDARAAADGLAQRIKALGAGRPIEIGISSSLLLVQTEQAKLLDGTREGEARYEEAMRLVAEGKAPPLPMGKGLQFILTLMRELNRGGKVLLHPVLLSRNHDMAAKALEVSLKAYGLTPDEIAQIIGTPHFMRGAPAADFVRIAKVRDLDLVLTANRADAQALADAGLPAVLVQAEAARPMAEWPRVSREVCDLDGVLFNLDREAIFGALLRLNERAGLRGGAVVQRAVVQYTNYMQGAYERGDIDAPGPLARFIGLLGAARDMVRARDPEAELGRTDVLTARSGFPWLLWQFMGIPHWNKAARALGVAKDPFSFGAAESCGTSDGRMKKGPFLRPEVTLLFEDSKIHVDSAVKQGVMVAEAVRPQQFEGRIQYFMQKLVADGYFTMPAASPERRRRRPAEAKPAGAGE